MTPIQGDWTISGIGLPAPVLRKIYFDNARQLLARALPAPVLKAARLTAPPTGHPARHDGDWKRAASVWLEQGSLDGRVRPELATQVKALWTAEHLHLAFVVPYTQLTTFDPPDLDKERVGLWERDVLEAFIGTEAAHVRRYAEFQVAPNGMQLDLKLDLPARDFQWNSGFKTTAEVDEKARVWTATMRIPLAALADQPPIPGTRWRINLYRCDYANEAFLSWRPTLEKTFHVPERFGVLEFVD
jgi:hypothetical protein